jgi:hypothetical protein
MHVLFVFFFALWCHVICACKVILFLYVLYNCFLFVWFYFAVLNPVQYSQWGKRSGVCIEVTTSSLHDVQIKYVLLSLQINVLTVDRYRYMYSMSVHYASILLWRRLYPQFYRFSFGSMQSNLSPYQRRILINTFYLKSKYL